MNRFLVLVGAALLSLAGSPVSAALNIFACEPEWAALASELGGEKLSVYPASTALQDPHRIEARPSLIARMRSADLAICSGAEIEIAWLPVLLRTAGNSKVQPGQAGLIFTSDYVQRLEIPARLDRSEGDVHPQGNPHVHLDPHNVTKIASVVTQRLAQIDSANAAYYDARGKEFASRWQQAIGRWEKEGAGLRGMKVVSHHKNLTYLFHWLGMIETANLEPKPGIPPTAGHLSGLVGRLQVEPADVIVRAAYNDPKAVQWLSKKTGIQQVDLPYTVGGTTGANDLFGLFDDTLARLNKAKQ